MSLVSFVHYEAGPVALALGWSGEPRVIWSDSRFWLVEALDNVRAKAWRRHELGQTTAAAEAELQRLARGVGEAPPGGRAAECHP